eukprot:4069902-Prymnesium_polylepis.1
MYGRPGHRVGVGLHGMFFTAVGGVRTLACAPNQVYLSTAGKGLTSSHNYELRVHQCECIENCTQET